MIRRALFATIIVSTLALVSAFILSNSVNGVVISILVGLLWLLLEYLQSRWGASLGLISVVILVAFGAMLESYAFLHAIAITAALSAWDLSRFRQRLAVIQQDDSWRIAAQRHLKRLLLVNSGGLTLAILAINLRFDASFYLEWILALSMLFLLFTFVIWLARLTR